MEETFLWPVAKSRTGQSGVGVGIELVGTYQNRAGVPRDVWLSLLQGAQEQIDVLVFSGTFFAQSNPYVAKMLTERASVGVRVRLCFGDPRGHAAAIRGREEGIGNTLAAKIRASLTYYRALLPEAGCEVRLHDTTLYNSLFRYDDNLLVNPHIWGQPASANPLFHLKKAQSNGWFDNYAQSFDAVWAGARPWNPDQEETAAHGQD
ncbi:XRE family transcriptional regulator [Streptomyces rapamycinicus NRRL 5491]|uniref:XRE family transcriptional regulator n=1 Tax=Streptomyces rapamycinicus (strain ATCC 29253 / DSM 41530 / NRRL 5491 / AYB-994) TaxID=1343740 RepID=A0A3L8R7X1_STRRN|nr:XRE family transcriptional regulator [Streptomyces rapamycinicus NRRL 5491]